MVLEEEKHRENTFNTTAPNVESIAALTAKPMKTSTNALKHTSFLKKKLVCSHCEYIGHTSNKCYRIHGFCTGIKSKRNVVHRANQISTFVGKANENVAQFSLPQE